MRHETCLTCRTPGAGDFDVQQLILIAEAVGSSVHHHHTVMCGGCGQWWFDDVVINGLGVLVANRRDTELCGCPDDLPQYTKAAIIAAHPEDNCTCTKTNCEDYSLPVRLKKDGAR